MVTGMMEVGVKRTMMMTKTVKTTLALGDGRI